MAKRRRVDELPTTLRIPRLLKDRMMRAAAREAGRTASHMNVSRWICEAIEMRLEREAQERKAS